MKRLVLVAAAAAIVGCTSMAPQAEGIRITRKAEEVRDCTPVGDVMATPPYILPNDDYKQMKNSAAALQADTVFVTSRTVISRGVAYRCKS